MMLQLREISSRFLIENTIERYVGRYFAPNDDLSEQSLNLVGIKYDQNEKLIIRNTNKL